jgi:hypothetical protein
MPLVMGGSMSVNCFPRGISPGLRGGVGRRWSREVAAELMAVIEEVVKDVSALTCLDMLPVVSVAAAVPD